MRKTVFSVTLSKLIELAIFFIVLVVLNAISWDNQFFIDFVALLNQNIWLILLYSFIFYFGDLFGVLPFPFNLPAPVFNAFGGAFLVGFIFNIFAFLAISLGISFFASIAYLEPFIVFLVFIIVLIANTILIFTRLLGITPEEPKKKKPGKKKTGSKKKKDEVDWQDIGNEIKKGFYNAAVSFQESFDPKKKK